MEQAIAALVALVEGLLPKLTDSAAVGNAISTIEALLPLVTQWATALLPAVKGIIAALAANPAATADQVTALQALDATADAAFDKAAADYAAAHPAT